MTTAIATRTVSAHTALELHTLGRITYRRTPWVAFFDGTFRHVVRATHYDRPLPDGREAVADEAMADAYDEWTWTDHSDNFPGDRITVAVARKLGLAHINSAQDGRCTHLPTERSDS